MLREFMGRTPTARGIKSSDKRPNGTEPNTRISQLSPTPSAVPSRAAASTKAFWQLMQSWNVPDATALELIRFPGKPGRSGKRPRFRLDTSQIRMLAYLQEIDRAVRVLHGEPAHWLNRPQKGKPMAGRTPLQTMIEGGRAIMPLLLRELTHTVMRRALK